jgi:hypothetical protein
MPSLHSYFLNAPRLPFSTMIAFHRTKKSPHHKEYFAQHPDTEACKASKTDEIWEHVRRQWHDTVLDNPLLSVHCKAPWQICFLSHLTTWSLIPFLNALLLNPMCAKSEEKPFVNVSSDTKLSTLLLLVHILLLFWTLQLSPLSLFLTTLLSTQQRISLPWMQLLMFRDRVSSSTLYPFPFSQHDRKMCWSMIMNVNDIFV